MSRQRIFATYALVVVALVVLFAGFIAVKDDAALIGALSAAGAVAAAGFAAVAAVGSMRAAAESGATARRSREALARTARPRLQPSLSGTHGVVRCSGERSAVEIIAVWLLSDRGPVTELVAHLAPGTEVTVDLALPAGADAWQAVEMVWIEYQDESRISHWRDTWQVTSRPDGEKVFVVSDSDLVD
ncbi:hypothetical protein WEI85_48435 [Actinomycetes bacterium KLBMP 9797]